MVWALNCESAVVSFSVWRDGSLTLCKPLGTELPALKRLAQQFLSMAAPRAQRYNPPGPSLEKEQSYTITHMKGFWWAGSLPVHKSHVLICQEGPVSPPPPPHCCNSGTKAGQGLDLNYSRKLGPLQFSRRRVANFLQGRKTSQN